MDQGHQALPHIPSEIAGWLQSLDVPDLLQTRAVCDFLVGPLVGDFQAEDLDFPQAFLDGLAMAGLLDGLHMDDTSLAVAILYRVSGDFELSEATICDQFGSEVSGLVASVHRIAAIRPVRAAGSQSQGGHLQAEQLRKMLLAMAVDIRVVMIRLAECVIRMRMMTHSPEGVPRQMAHEVLDIYAPLANRLGIWQLKWELEDLSLRYLEPQCYQQIARLLDERRVDREIYVADVVDTVRHECDKAGIVHVRVTGRPKHIYSIWRKMERKQLHYHDIYDVRGIRILVDDINACYTALGAIHSLWQYIPGEFDDYIATPKENGYRSIHTAVIGPQGKIVEIQIRSYAMHEHNELGVAAHWRYKEGGNAESAFDSKIAWLRQLLDWKDVAAEEGDIVDRFRNAVFLDRIYVFSPKGKVIDLPRGATPLDFAYKVHTDVGHCCRGAKVNGRMVTLTYQLESGECVEILTTRQPGPSRDWLNVPLGYLKTSRARSKVQHWFRQQDREKNMAAGRQILDRELRRMGLSAIRREILAERLAYNDIDDFLLAVAYNECKAARFLQAAQELSQVDSGEAEVDVPLGRPSTHEQRGKGIQIQGVGNLLTNMAQCCKPVPGDDISGYITVGRGISIHRADCANLERCLARHPERVVNLDWGADADEIYPVDIQVKAFDRQGLLRDITALVTSYHINLVGVRTHTDKRGHTARMRLTIEIPNLDTLSMVLMQMAQLPNILDVRRVTR